MLRRLINIMNDNKTTPLISSPFVAASLSVAQVMRTVIYALVPGILIYIGLFGWGVLINIVLASISAIIFEWLMLLLRNRPVKVFLFDGSAILTAILLALAIPPSVPWWVPVIGCFFAIVVAKHLYGGLGYNTFNPAMAAYAILLISFPKELSLWTLPLDQLNQPLSFLESVKYSLFHVLPSTIQFDSMTSATLLDYVRTEVGLGKNIEVISRSPIFGYVSGTGYEFVNAGFLLGGLWLIYRKIISWHIPLAMLLAITFISSISFVIDSNVFSNPLVHLLGGASILGAFFIATDPITASTTPRGRIIYGLGIGFITFSIRTWGGYPDGVAFAVLLMGLTVPLLDHYTMPKVYGARSTYDKN